MYTHIELSVGSEMQGLVIVCWRPMIWRYSVVCVLCCTTNCVIASCFHPTNSPLAMLMALLHR